LERSLRRAGYANLLVAARRELDLTQQADVEAFFQRERPGYVFLAADRAGGIVANRSEPVEFIRTNLAIEIATIEAAHRAAVQGLLLFGASCMYPRLDSVPIREEDLFRGPLEPTSRPYAVSKIAGIELCRAYRTQYGRRFFTMVPATLYGPWDHFRSGRAHVIPALIDRFHRAKTEDLPSVTVLGTGRARREFLYCDDAADAAIFLMGSGEKLDLVNVGTGEELTIADLAHKIARTVGYGGGIRFDPAHPDGAPRKLLDSSRVRALGWKPNVPLDEGLGRAYEWYLRHPEGAESGSAEERARFPAYS
jgi:GDP-L-fucose synthase